MNVNTSQKQTHNVRHVCLCVCVRASLVSLLVLPYTRFYVCHIGMCDGARCVSIIGTKTMCVVLSCDVCCYYFAVLVVVFCCRGRGYDQKDFPQPQPLDSVVRSYFTHSGYFKTITETQTNINTHTHNYCPLYAKCCCSVCRFSSSLCFCHSSTFDLERNLFVYIFFFG